jgi:hypothetical protein
MSIGLEGMAVLAGVCTSGVLNLGDILSRLSTTDRSSGDSRAKNLPSETLASGCTVPSDLIPIQACHSSLLNSSPIMLDDEQP